MQFLFQSQIVAKTALYFGLLKLSSIFIHRCFSSQASLDPSIKNSLLCFDSNKTQNGKEKLIPQIAIYLENNIDGWEGCTGYQSQFLSGAMTNTVIKFWKNNGANSHVIVRIYGKNTDIFFDRDNEIASFKRMSAIGLGPKLLAIEDWGRIEEYVDAMTLTAPLMKEPHIVDLIAKKMYQFHQLATEIRSVEAIEPQLFKMLYDWEMKAFNIYGNYAGKWDLKMIGNLTKIYENFVKQKLHSSPIVFSHNDLQYGNFLYKEDKNELMVIDFEYSGYNYRGFDIGSHWCEWCANYHSSTPHKLDFSLMPNDEMKYYFCRQYLSSSQQYNSENEFNQAVQQLVFETKLLIPASHLVWGIWAIIQNRISQIDFDFMDYADQRLNAFIDSMEQLELIK